MGRHHFYADAVPLKVEQSADNAHFRAKHGFKETQVHDPPPRRNNDFKPVHSWSAKGMPNYKHSEPFYLLKNLPQFFREEQNFVIRWAKRFLEGGVVGGFLGYAMFAFSPR